MIMGSIVHCVLHTLKPLHLSYGSLEIMSIQYEDIVWDNVACCYLPRCQHKCLLSKQLITLTTH